MHVSEVIQSPVAQQESLRESLLKQLHVAMPGIIHAYDPDTRTAVVAPSIRQKGDDGKYRDLPLLTDVPVFNPNGIFPVRQGDGCLVVFADSCMDAWLTMGDVQNPVVQRSHDLSDGFAFVGFRPMHQDDEAFTHAEKDNACSVIGAERSKGDWKLMGSISGTSDDRGNIDTGLSVNLAGCTELYIYGVSTGTATSGLTTNVTTLVSSIVTNGTRKSVCFFEDLCGNLSTRNARYAGATNTGLASVLSGYIWYGKTIKDITLIKFGTSSAVTSCDYKIYAR